MPILRRLLANPVVREALMVIAIVVYEAMRDRRRR